MAKEGSGKNGLKLQKRLAGRLRPAPANFWALVGNHYRLSAREPGNASRSDRHPGPPRSATKLNKAS